MKGFAFQIYMSQRRVDAVTPTGGRGDHLIADSFASKPVSPAGSLGYMVFQTARTFFMI